MPSIVPATLSARCRAARLPWAGLQRRGPGCAVRVAVVIVALGSTTPAAAQDRVPADAKVYFESLALVPTIRVADIGWDDNVFYESEEDDPQSDFTTTVSPAVQAWFRLPALLVRGRSQVDFVYYKDLSPIRSTDTSNEVHAEFLLGHLVPYLDGAWEDRRYREYDELIIEAGAGGGGGQNGGLEIEQPVRRIDSWWGGGVDLWLSGKTSVGVLARRARVNYKGDEPYRGTDLNTLDAESTIEGIRARYRATPFTTVGVDLERYRTTFPSGGERDSEGGQVAAVVEFEPRATLNGSMRIGVRRREFLDGNSPEFNGLVAHWGLGFTVLERTRFALGLHRDLSYSYRADQRDYLESGVELSVTHRLADSWDVGGRVGRFNLSYGAAAGGTSEPSTDVPPDERVTRYRLETGYYLGRTRLGVYFDRQTRSAGSEVDRGYAKTRICSSLAYRF